MKECKDGPCFGSGQVVIMLNFDSAGLFPEQNHADAFKIHHQEP